MRDPDATGAGNDHDEPLTDEQRQAIQSWAREEREHWQEIVAALDERIADAAEGIAAEHGVAPEDVLGFAAADAQIRDLPEATEDDR